MNCANHPDRERVSFCQNCGKPLCAECTRRIGPAVFCEPCLAARLAAADATATAQGSPAAGAYASPVTPAYGSPAPGAPNPILAGALGFIPGVGAMYNGQYAKGVVHLVIFAVLVSLANDNGAFGILVAGWLFYQVFEAYHTARARRDGTVLPNPFGLNEIGDKFGFGKAWPASAPFSGPAAPPMPGAPYSSNVSSPFVQDPGSSQQVSGAGASRFEQVPGTGQQYAAPPASPYSSYTAPPVPGSVPYSAPFEAAATDGSFVPQPSRFPTGAIVLIALGVLFFFGSSGVFHHFPIEQILPFLLIALGIWIFVRKMTSAGSSLTDDGSPTYRMRIFRALRGSVWVVLVGVAFLLDSFDILGWGKSWPLFIIVAGLMFLFERSAHTAAAAAAPYAYPAPASNDSGPYSQHAAAAPVSSTESLTVVPRGDLSHNDISRNDEER